MKIILNQPDLIFLLRWVENEELHSIFRRVSEGQESDSTESVGTKQYVVTLNSSQREEVLDALSILLSDRGIDNETYEPNNFGLHVEKLIDIFNPYS